MKKAIIFFCTIAPIIGFCQNSVFEDSLDSNNLNINVVGIDFVGNFYICGMEYSKGRHFEKYDVLGSVGLGLHNYQPLAGQIKISLIKTTNKIQPFLSFGGEITFGNDKSYGYDSFSAYASNEPSFTGPPGTSVWHKRLSINGLANVGLSYFTKKSIGFSAYYCLKYQNSYLGMSNYVFKNLFGFKTIILI